MLIHAKKECPNPINISSNTGIGNLVKETLLTAPYNNPPFAFPAPKEKRKYISVSSQTQKLKIKVKNKKNYPMSVQTQSRVHPDATSIHANGKNIFLL
jgi:hypothetical protein